MNPLTTMKKYAAVYYPNSGAGYIVMGTFDTMEEAQEKASQLTREMLEKVEHGRYIAKRIKAAVN